MIKTLFIGVVSILLTSAAGAYEMKGVIVDTSEGLVIGSEAHCVESRGIPIKETPDNQVRAACLRDQNVRWACNADGSHARVKAYREWTAKVMDFKDRCSGIGGTFSYADAHFQEPTDDSFCSLAQPQVQYSDFETPMCNFVSRCPNVAVSCIRDEEAIQHPIPQRTVLLPGIPNAINIAVH